MKREYLIDMKWEYLIEAHSVTDYAHAAIQDLLTHQGSDGWELVSIFKQGFNYVCFFKRPRKGD